MKKIFLPLVLLFTITLFSCEDSPVSFTQSDPDLSPEIIVNWGGALTGIDIFTIKIHNTGAPTTATSVFYIQKMDPVATIIVPSQPGIIVTEQGTRWKIEITENIQSYKEVLFVIEPTLTGSAGITASVVAGTGGGETPTNNNITVYNFTVI